MSSEWCFNPLADSEGYFNPLADSEGYFSMLAYTAQSGRVKEWGYADLGTGQAVVRWGRYDALRGSQLVTRQVALDRFHEKLRKGYRGIGLVYLNASGSREASTPPPPKAPDINALLGEDEGVFF